MGHRWCDADDIAALVRAGEAVYPVQLGELLAEPNALGLGPRHERPASRSRSADILNLASATSRHVDSRRPRVDIPNYSRSQWPL